MKKIVEIVRKELGDIPVGVYPIGSGIIAKTFGFSVNKREYIIRFNTRKIDFEKDKYCSENFSSNKIPIPGLLKIGKAGAKSYYAISEKCKGQLIDDFDNSSMEKLLIKVFNLMFEIKSVLLTEDGYGEFDKNGKADYGSWRSYILSAPQTDDVSKMLYEKILQLIIYCPEERYLIHGDLGFNNILSDGKNITGIIDWGDAKYGDFVYDMSWISFWLSEIPYEKLFKIYINERNIFIKDYQERMLCYKFFLAIKVLYFLKRTGDLKTYNWVKDKILMIAALK